MFLTWAYSRLQSASVCHVTFIQNELQHADNLMSHITASVLWIIYKHLKHSNCNHIIMVLWVSADAIEESALLWDFLHDLLKWFLLSWCTCIKVYSEYVLCLRRLFSLVSQCNDQHHCFTAWSHVNSHFKCYKKVWSFSCFWGCTIISQMSRKGI